MSDSVVKIYEQFQLKKSPETQYWEVGRIVLVESEGRNEGTFYFEIHSTHKSPVDAAGVMAKLNHADLDAVNPLQALQELFDYAWGGYSGSAPVMGRFLLGLYNGERFPFDLGSLTKLDKNYFARVESLLRFNQCLVREIHSWLNEMNGCSDFGGKFEKLAERYGLLEPENG